MEVKEIEGVKFVEYKKHKQQRRKMIIQIIFIIAIIYSSYAMIKTGRILLENKEIIQEDPFKYGMDSRGYVSCSCIDSNGNAWSTNNVALPGNYTIDFSNFEVNENRTSRNN